MRGFVGVLSLVGLVLSLPLCLLTALLIVLDSGRPVFFRQERVGTDDQTRAFDPIDRIVEFYPGFRLPKPGGRCPAADHQCRADEIQLYRCRWR